jgi:SAM-dependent methyltransferase
MKLTTRLAYKVFPSHLWSAIREEAKLTRIRWFGRRPASALLKRRGIRLHLGCGPLFKEGWVNVDGAPQAQLDLQWDLRRPLPFADGGARMIYSEHLLEHLHKEDALGLLAECYRMLESGGRLRLGVPDAEIYLRAYVAGDGEFFRHLKHLGGAVIPLATPMDVVNQMFRMGGAHLFAWDYQTLAAALSGAGFVGVKRWASGQASSPEICLDDPEHAFETLYVEASKPVEASS